ncbi:MAG: hypothetical protein EPN37_08005 [Chitinophagaceae bacterium]|nr:MAG: hypothetical protein EPN37_08005 [Chitinophagaceae bacterium]
MLKELKVYKKSGTYAETLEAFGVADLLNEVLERNSIPGGKVVIEDKGHHYSLKVSPEITEEMINDLPFFQIIKFIKKDEGTEVPNGITDFFNYPEQKGILDDYKNSFQDIDKNKSLTSDQKKTARKELNEQKNSEFGRRIDPEFDVYREIKGNPYSSFSNLYNNFYANKDQFPEMVNSILTYYSQGESLNNDIVLSDDKPTAQQLYNPNQGKGLNKTKANNASMGNLKSFWISETMKISGSLPFMSCQYVKVGSSYDLKIFVPEFKQIILSQAKRILFDFKRELKSTSPVKLDILNIVNLSIKFILRTPEYNKGKIKNTVKGFHSVYLKDLGQNKAVANIAFINIPDFISYKTRMEGHEWIEILENQKKIISGIIEQGDSIQGLQFYRIFLGSTEITALDNFSKFSYWYCSYLMQAITRKKYYVTPFKTETLNKFYKNMDTQELNLMEIINDDGFLAIASAIRKSTVSLQYTPKEKRQFEIRYGLAQQLQNKSKSKEDLATFIGGFVGTYNAETARYAEKKGKAPRATVKDGELLQFYKILDNAPARLIGALLASYGFALTSKEFSEKENIDTEIPEEEN